MSAPAAPADGLVLLFRARADGLVLHALSDGRLEVRGRRTLAPLAQEILGAEWCALTGTHGARA